MADENRDSTSTDHDAATVAAVATVAAKKPRVAVLSPMPPVYTMTRPRRYGGTFPANPAASLNPGLSTSSSDDGDGSHPHGKSNDGNGAHPHSAFPSGNGSHPHFLAVAGDGSHSHGHRPGGFGYTGRFGHVPDASDLRDREFETPLPSAAALATATPDRSTDPRVDRRYAEAFKPAFPAAPARASLLLASPPDEMPEWVDLRPFMGPINDQGQSNSCTAHAVMGAVDYLQIAQTGTYVDGSPWFLYKTTRDLMSQTGDVGVEIRAAIKSLALFGSCPDAYFSADDFTGGDEGPDAFCFSVARRFEALDYYRAKDLSDIKKSIAMGYPVALGFTCYESLDTPDVAATGTIPYPVPHERTIGSHAVLAVGYIDGGGDPAETAGRLIIRNSWGAGWGVGGYGTLPYEYIAGNALGWTQLSDDYWTLTLMSRGKLPGRHVAPYTMIDWPEK